MMTSRIGHVSNEWLARRYSAPAGQAMDPLVAQTTKQLDTRPLFAVANGEPAAMLAALGKDCQQYISSFQSAPDKIVAMVQSAAAAAADQISRLPPQGNSGAGYQVVVPLDPAATAAAIYNSCLVSTGQLAAQYTSITPSAYSKAGWATAHAAGQVAPPPPPPAPSATPSATPMAPSTPVHVHGSIMGFLGVAGAVAAGVAGGLAIHGAFAERSKRR